MRITASFVGLVVASLAAPAFAAEGPDYAALLAREVIGPELAMQQVMDYTEARVAPLPQPASAEAWPAEADRIRQQVLERVVYRGEAAAWRDADCRVEFLDIIEGGPGYSIRKLRYEALPGLWIPALLYEPATLEGRVPAMLAVNGHDGKGKAAPYKQVRCINLAKRGMVVLNLEWLGMGQLSGDAYRHYRMNQLDLCGTSGLAPFYLAVRRGLDILCAHEHVDTERVAVSGLSGGGWQTITISSLDTRVKLANPVAGYSSFRTRVRNFSDLGDSEQTPVDLAATADYATLTAMLAPRGALLTYNAADDCCFAADHALPPLLDAAGPFYKLLGQETRLRSHVNHDPGTHNFERDNREALYRMIGDVFYEGSTAWDTVEIPCDEEIKTAEQLQVELPGENATFNSLARGLAASVPRQGPLGAGSLAAAAAWQATNRAKLRGVLRWQPLAVEAEHKGTEDLDTLHVKLWALHMSHAWTVPAVELSPLEPKGTVVLVGDEGRAALAAEAQRLVESGLRVVALDPFYLGESKIRSHDFLFALLVSSVGDRPLGIQAAQLAAAAGWVKSQYAVESPTIVAHGPRTSLAALCAAAVDESSVAGVELHGSLASLKEIVEADRSVEQAPELFCFGLLEHFDVAHLAALAAPWPVKVVGATDRHRTELAPLADWYKTLGADIRVFE
jgi:dienelactone hydrolase